MMNKERSSGSQTERTSCLPVMEFRQVTCSYEPGVPVLKDLSFRIGEGETVGLIGPNGAGKSTVMRVLLGLMECEGSVSVGGMPVRKENLAEIRRKTGFVLQNSDNQMFMPTVFEDMIFAPLNYGIPREEAEKKADEVLSRLGLSELKHRHNHRISGGEKRMAAIAVILAMEPEVILMDEPTSALDPYNRRLVINTIRDLPGAKLISSHDLDMILDTCGRVILISDGRLAAEGPAEKILSDRELLEANRLELPLSLSGTL